MIGVSSYVEEVDRSPWVAQRSAVLPHRYVDAARARRRGGRRPATAAGRRRRARGCRPVASRRPRPRRRGRRRGRPLRRRAAPDRAGAAPRPRRVGARARPGVGTARDCRCSASAAACRSWPSRREACSTAPAGRRRARRALLRGPGSTPRTTRRRSQGTRLAEVLGSDPLDVPTYHHQSVRPQSLEGTAYRPVGLARRRHPRGDGGPVGPLPARSAVAPGGGGGRPPVRGPRRRRGAAGRVRSAGQPSAQKTAAGDNRPVTRLNRLAIAAGAASALGALAAAGRGVNASMGGRPSGDRLERMRRSPAYRAGAFHNTSRGDVVDAVGAARRAPPVPRERRYPSAGVADPRGQHPPRAADRGGARHVVRARVVPRRARRRATAARPGVERAVQPQPARRPAAPPRRARAADRARAGRRRRHLPRPLRPPRHGHRPPARST